MIKLNKLLLIKLKKQLKKIFIDIKLEKIFYRAKFNKVRYAKPAPPKAPTKKPEVN